MSDIGPAASAFSSRQRNEIRTMIERVFRRMFAGSGDAAATALAVARAAASSVGAVVIDVDTLKRRESYRRVVAVGVTSVTVGGSSRTVTVPLTSTSVPADMPGPDYGVQVSVAGASGVNLGGMTATPDLSTRTVKSVDVVVRNTGLAAIASATLVVYTSPPPMTA